MTSVDAVKAFKESEDASEGVIKILGSIPKEGWDRERDEAEGVAIW